MASTPRIRRACIVHGFAATPEDHWFGWLADELEAAGIQAIVPAMPDSAAPRSDAWVGGIQAVLGRVDERTALVGHSLGCLAILRVLLAEPAPWRLGRLVLVAGFVERLDAVPELDAFIGGDAARESAAIRDLAARVDEAVVIRSDNDGVVPAERSDRLAALLGARVEVVPGAAHFAATDGVTTLEAARDAILRGQPDAARYKATPGA